jgi:RNA polymerase sigma factor (sigma-70 family)
MVGSRSSDSTLKAQTVGDLLAPQNHQELRYVYDRLIAYARRRGLTHQDSEDLTQEVLLRAWQRRNQFSPRPGGSLVAWILTVAKNLLIDRLRTKAAEGRLTAGLGEDPASEYAVDSQLSELADREAARRRAALICRLPEELRPVFWSWVEQSADGGRREVAAEQLGMSIAAYEAAKKRVRRAITKDLEELGYGPRDVLTFGPRLARLVDRAGSGEDE